MEIEKIYVFTSWEVSGEVLEECRPDQPFSSVILWGHLSPAFLQLILMVPSQV